MQPLLCYFKAPGEGLAGPIAPWLKARVQRALEDGLDPVVMPSVGLQRLPVAMPPGMAARVRDLAEQWGVAPGRMVGMLALAAQERERAQERGREQPPKSTTEPAAPAGAASRPEQLRLLAAAAPLLDADKIVLIEAGTGVGKSRLAGLLAAHCLDVRGETAIIATPTVAQLSHLADEIAALRASGSVEHLPAPMLLLGRGNFIDLEAAEDFALEQGLDEALRWVRAGAPAGLTEATRLLARHMPGAMGLMEDWMHLLGEEDVTEDYSADDFCLTEDSAEESGALYAELRTRAREHPFVLCTHAMLASDCIAKKRDQAGMVDHIGTLLLDEAHLFEEEVAKVASQDVSLWSLERLLKRESWSSLRAGAMAGRAAAAAAQSISKLAKMPFAGKSSLMLPADLERAPEIAAAWEGCDTSLRTLVDELDALSKRLQQAKDMAGWRNAQRQVQAASRALMFALTGSYSVELTLSPVKKLARMKVGPRSVAHYLRNLWDDCGCAALLSATLYVPTARGDTSFYINKVLALPPDRAVQTVAEHPAWITESPMLMLPSPKSLPRLMPPTGEAADEKAMNAWTDEVAACVRMAAAEAAGGTLVLLSSYERLERLASRLEADLFDRLVVQRRNKGVVRCKGEFVELARQGARPIWLATGGAWTGLDLRDDRVPDADAQMDMLLTDLVIPNIPLGLNKATTHAARTESFKPMEGMSTALLFRQGLGRLIRRSGLVRRRIWMLDARLLVRAATTSGSIYSPCLMMLERFPRRERFDLPPAETAP